MGSRIAPDGGTRFLVVSLAFALVISLIGVVASKPALAVSGDLGPTMVPGASTAGLEDEDGQWDTKNQHRSWFVEGRWDAILPMAAAPNGPASVESGWWIVQQAIPETLGALPTPKVEVSTGSADRPDVFWDDAENRLYVLMSGANTTSLYVYTYVDGTDTYTFSHTSSISDFEAANSRAAIFKDSSGDLWASKMDGGGLMVSRSEDDGVTWATPANLIFPVGEGQTQITQVGTTLAVAAAEDGDGGNELGRYSKYLFYSLPMAQVANWDAIDFATATLSMTVLPLAGETVTVEGRTYTFQDAPLTDVSGNVLIGTTLALTQANLVSAINGDGVPGVDYAASTLPNPHVFVDDFAANTATLHAKESGTPGNAIDVAETMVNGAFSSTTLLNGASPWVTETVPLTQGSNPTTQAVVHADDELSLIRNGTDIYIATETQRTSFVNTAHTLDPQVVLYKRTSGGVWTQHNVKMDQQSSVGDRKRPVVAILDASLYIFSIDNSRTNSAYWVKPLSGLPLTAWGTTTPLFSTQFEAYRNNIAPRDPVTASQRLPVLIDWANEDPSEDNTIWQTSLPNLGNQAPGVSAGADATVAGSPASTIGGVISNDGQGGPVAWAWSQVSGPGVANFTSGTGSCATPQCLLTTTATFTALGTYVLKLTANEAAPDPLTNFDEVTITVNTIENTPPVLTVSEPDNGDSATAGAAVTFQASAIDPPDGDISADIVWTSSRDGIIGLGGFFTKSNLTLGVHTIRATITDGQNTVQSPPISLTIGPPGPPPPPPPTPPANPVFRAAGDFTGDGRSDTVTYNGSDGRWWVFASNGSKFTPKQWAKFTTVSGWTSRVVGDFNNDGKDDIATYHPATGKWVVLKAGTSSFTTATWSTFTTKSGWSKQLVGDFNGDGRDDIANYHPGTGRWIVSRSTGTAFSNSIWSTFSTKTGWGTQVVGDFNNDGRDDIANYHTATGRWVMARSTGSGFATSIWSTFSTTSGWTTQTVGDFNNDGRDDIANYHTGTGRWVMARSTGSGFATSIWSTFSTKTGWTAQVVGDFNNDGRADIANYHPATGNLVVSRSTGSGFTNNVWSTFGTKTGWKAHLVGDYNNDGRSDLANHYQTGRWVVSRSTGSAFSNVIWYP